MLFCIKTIPKLWGEVFYCLKSIKDAFAAKYITN